MWARLEEDRAEAHEQEPGKGRVSVGMSVRGRRQLLSLLFTTLYLFYFDKNLKEPILMRDKCSPLAQKADLWPV